MPLPRRVSTALIGVCWAQFARQSSAMHAVGSLVLQLARLFVSLCAALVAYLWIRHDPEYTVGDDWDPPLSSPLFPTLVRPTRCATQRWRLTRLLAHRWPLLGRIFACRHSRACSQARCVLCTCATCWTCTCIAASSRPGIIGYAVRSWHAERRWCLTR